MVEMDGRTAVHHFTLTAPHRLVLDFEDAQQIVGRINQPDEQIILPLQHSFIERARIGHINRRLRIVFDLTARPQYEINWSGTNLLVRFTAPSHRVAQPVSAAPPQASQPPSSPPARSAKALEKAATKSGKKHFQEGLKQETLEQWDSAAQSFTSAVAAEPSNTEYRLHLLRALQRASILMAKRGAALESRQDYAGAYAAYYQAFTYDPTNDLAKAQMERLATMQRAKAEGREQQPYYPATASAASAATDISLPKGVGANDVLHVINFHDADLRQVIENMAGSLGLNVLFDESFKNETKFRFKLNNVTMARALDMILTQTKHTFEQMDRRTILIYADNPTNRQRLEQMLIKTFYLGNADLEQARTLIQAISGGQRLVMPVKQMNAIVVRDTASNLRMIQELLDSVDKNRAEVVIDVDIYEVSRNASLELGNQLAANAQPVTETRFDAQGNPVTVTRGQSSSLGNLGGIGRAGIAAIAGTTVSPVLGGVGTLLGLPPSSLSLLQSKGQSRLLANSQIHALDGEQNQTKVGRSVPVRIGSTFIPSYPTAPNNPVGAVAGAVQGMLGGGGLNSGFDSIQYRDVGLVIDVTPTITKEGFVQIKMKLESSSVEASGTDISLTPSFTQRTLTTVARVMNGKTAVVAGIKQEAKGDSRAGLPVVGMLPLLGRFFTTPRQTSNLSDIVITVTPHIIRAPELKKEDHLARLGGGQQRGVSPTIETVVMQAQTEDDQERRERGNKPRPSAPPPVTAQIADARTAVADPTVTDTAVNATPTISAPVEVRAEPATVSAPSEAPAISNALDTTASTEAPRTDRVSLKLVSTPTRPRAGETFTVGVAVNGSALMTGATIALNFDPALLQFKSVRDGGLLTGHAALRQQVSNGQIHLTLQPTAGHSAPVFAQGQLLLLEFTALQPGQASVEFNLSDTSLQLSSTAQVQLSARSTQIQIIGTGGAQ
ncbi:MAG TPA: cohesin domain-containing protein [Blastocatellia bacterium]|nr:cohesin domain-containing protein [Blastocatellia bacterium]